MYETYNFFINYIKNNKDIKNLEECYKRILICFSPVIPHLSNECLKELGEDTNIEWPRYDENLLQEDQIDLVIQINGKKRSVLNVKKGISKKDLFEITKKDKILDKYLSNNEIKKIIFVKDRLMNILIND